MDLGNDYQTVLESHPAKPPQKPTVSGILEWIRCFNIYMAVISHKQPTRIPILLAYETLIIEAHMEYSSQAWSEYDRQSRLCAGCHR